jgi:hypothetical protein
MERFLFDGIEVWVGVVPKLGPVVYDPASQIDVADKVRLYVRDESRMATL